MEDKKAEWERLASKSAVPVIVSKPVASPSASASGISISEASPVGEKEMEALVPSDLFNAKSVSDVLGNKSKLFRGPDVSLSLRLSRGIIAARDWCAQALIPPEHFPSPEMVDRSRDRTNIMDVNVYLFTPWNLNVYHMLGIQLAAQNVYVDSQKPITLGSSLYGLEVDSKQVPTFRGGSPAAVNFQPFLEFHKSSGGTRSRLPVRPAVLYFCLNHSFLKTFEQSLDELLHLIWLARALARHLPAFCLMWNDFADRQWAGAEENGEPYLYGVSSLPAEDRKAVKDKCGLHPPRDPYRVKKNTQWAEFVRDLVIRHKKWPDDTLALEEARFGSSDSSASDAKLRFREVYGPSGTTSLFAIDFSARREMGKPSTDWLGAAIRQDLTFAKEVLLTRVAVVLPSQEHVYLGQPPPQAISSVGLGAGRGAQSRVDALTASVVSKTELGRITPNPEKTLEHIQKYYVAIDAYLRKLGVSGGEALMESLSSDTSPRTANVAATLVAGLTEPQLVKALSFAEQLMNGQSVNKLIVNTAFYQVDTSAFYVRCQDMPGVDYGLIDALEPLRSGLKEDKSDRRVKQHDRILQAYEMIAEQKEQKQQRLPTLVYVNLPWLKTRAFSNVGQLMKDAVPALRGFIKKVAVSSGSGIVMFPVPSNDFNEVWFSAARDRYARNTRQTFDFFQSEGNTLNTETVRRGPDGKMHAQPPTLARQVFDQLLEVDSKKKDALWKRLPGSKTGESDTIQVILSPLSRRLSVMYVVFRGKNTGDSDWWTRLLQHVGNRRLQPEETNPFLSFTDRAQAFVPPGTPGAFSDLISRAKRQRVDFRRSGVDEQTSKASYTSRPSGGGGKTLIIPRSSIKKARIRNVPWWSRPDAKPVRKRDPKKK
jgi:hypothetical protein